MAPSTVRLAARGRAPRAAGGGEGPLLGRLIASPAGQPSCAKLNTKNCLFFRPEGRNEKKPHAYRTIGRPARPEKGLPRSWRNRTLRVKTDHSKRIISISAG